MSVLMMATAQPKTVEIEIYIKNSQMKTDIMNALYKKRTKEIKVIKKL
jgi:hypothetical protein